MQKTPFQNRWRISCNTHKFEYICKVTKINPLRKLESCISFFWECRLVKLVSYIVSPMLLVTTCKRSHSKIPHHFSTVLRWFIPEYEGKTVFWSFWHFPLHNLNHITTKESRLKPLTYHREIFHKLGVVSEYCSKLKYSEKISLENFSKRHVN